MDILSTLEGFLQIIPETLTDGYTVDLGSMGVLAKSLPVDTAKDFHHSKIEGLKVVFRPGKLFMQSLDDAEFTKIT